MRSALFVDFDNVFTQLKQLQPAAAERFARFPADWIRWLADALPPGGTDTDLTPRRILVRRCYLNPNWYQTYRHSFLKAGFEIVDCPPVTSQGKTSTDIHMVLDIVDLLQHETRFDEFIVFSADADFTPVLRKLRRHDRRTTVLAIGFPSAAYQASADLLIDERLFIQNALGLEERGTSQAARTESVLPEDSHGTSVPTDEQGGAEATKSPTRRPEGARRARANEATRATPAESISQELQRAREPVAAARLATWLKKEHPEITEDWNGLGSFKQFFRSLQLPGLVWAPSSGGRILDSTRHSLEVDLGSEPGPGWEDHMETFQVARDVSYSTGTPMLAPRHLRIVLEFLSAEVQQHQFELARTAQRVCDQCLEREDVPVALRDVIFLIRGMQLNGHAFGEGHDDVPTLTERLLSQVLFLCGREQMVLDGPATSRIEDWISGVD